ISACCQPRQRIYRLAIPAQLKIELLRAVAISAQTSDRLPRQNILADDAVYPSQSCQQAMISVAVIDYQDLPVTPEFSSINHLSVEGCHNHGLGPSGQDDAARGSAGLATFAIAMHQLALN